MAALVGDLGDVSLMTPAATPDPESTGVAGVASDAVPRRWRVPQRRSFAMSDQTAQPDSTKPLRGAKGTSEGYPEGPGFMNRRGVLRAFGAGAAVVGGGG